ncbi:MAG: M20/M25/M40 family metallo-hydrolase [Microthrixaceae bacterium]
MDEDNDVPYRSRVAGVAHACGHDVHSTVVLGSGLALADSLVAGGHSSTPDLRAGGGTGARWRHTLIASGWLDGIESVYGLHCDPKIDVGHVGTRQGAITWAADLVEISLHGPGGHTASSRPSTWCRGIVAGSGAAPARLGEGPRRGAAQLPGRCRPVRPRRRTGPRPSGRIIAHTGPTGVGRSGERSLPPPWREILEDTGLDWQIEHRRGVPPVINHDRQTDLVEQAVRDSIGPDALVETPQSAAASSFAWYLEATGGTYVRLSGTYPDLARRVDLHSSEFDVDESAIGIGVRVLTSVVLADLGSPHRGISRAASP